MPLYLTTQTGFLETKNGISADINSLTLILKVFF